MGLANYGAIFNPREMRLGGAGMGTRVAKAYVGRHNTNGDVIALDSAALGSVLGKPNFWNNTVTKYLAIELIN